VPAAYVYMHVEIPATVYMHIEIETAGIELYPAVWLMFLLILKPKDCSLVPDVTISDCSGFS
jgi:hypothetical protein